MIPTAGQSRLFWLALTGLAVAVLLALIGAAVWGLGRLLEVLSPVLWPLAVAAVIACVLSPLVDWLEHRAIPRTRAVLLVFVVVFSLAAGALASLIPQVVVETEQLIARVPDYSQRLQHHLTNLLAQDRKSVV